MAETIAVAAELVVQRPLPDALALFTPEGERDWAAGWDPVYPTASRREGAGAVFLTRHGAQTTTWVIVDHQWGEVRYARWVPGESAGTVSVTVLDSDPTRTRLRVSYDLTALSHSAARHLELFAEEFPAYIASWEAAISATADTPDLPDERR